MGLTPEPARFAPPPSKVEVERAWLAAMLLAPSADPRPHERIPFVMPGGHDDGTADMLALVRAWQADDYDGAAAVLGNGSPHEMLMAAVQVLAHAQELLSTAAGGCGQCAGCRTAFLEWAAEAATWSSHP